MRRRRVLAAIVVGIALCVVSLRWLAEPGQAVPLVLGFHLTRTVLCNLLVGPIHRLGLRLGLL